MPSKPILSASAILFAFAGTMCLFMPVADGGLSIQLFGATLIGFAGLNWIAKDSTLGGIYGRPITLANFLHCAIATLLILRVILDEPGNEILWFVAILYALFALAFGIILFGVGKRAQ